MLPGPLRKKQGEADGNQVRRGTAVHAAGERFEPWCRRTMSASPIGMSATMIRNQPSSRNWPAASRARPSSPDTMSRTPLTSSHAVGSPDGLAGRPKVAAVAAGASR